MMYPWHYTQWQRVIGQWREQRLPHALLLTGQPGLGKWVFARALAATLLCRQVDTEGHACGECSSCKLIRAGTHPDYLPVEPEAPDKAIKVDDIRALCGTLVLTSQLGGLKLALMNRADNMNINAANSLLKTLEEPTDGSILILVSSRPQRLPITIRSRCQRIDFPLPVTSQALQWLQEQGCESAPALLSQAHGSPLLALSLAEAEQQAPRRLLAQALVPARDRPSALAAAAELAKYPQDALFGDLYDWISDLIRARQLPEPALIHGERGKEIRQLAERLPAESLYAYLDEVIRVRRTQSIPLNAQLLWEDLLISWERLITRA